MVITDAQFALELEESPSHCSVVARRNGEDPVGSAPYICHILFLELPFPWEADISDTPHFPYAVSAILKEAARAGMITHIQCIAPDPDYSRPGLTRMILFHRPEGLCADYESEEYLVPPERIESLLETLLLRRDDLLAYESFRQNREGMRDIFVCTHQIRDACCGKFGLQLFHQLRERATENLRFWQTNHLGGHRLSPTFAEFPAARFWGHLSPSQADAVIERTGAVDALRMNIRGWSGARTDWEQAAERDLFIAKGWDWLDCRKEIRIQEKGETESTVEIAFAESPDGPVEFYESAVEVIGTVTTQASCGKEKISRSRLLRVNRLERRPEPAAITADVA